MIATKLTRVVPILVLSAITLLQGTEPKSRKALVTGTRLPTGVDITPTAARNSTFTPLNPDLPTRPDYVADHAVSTAMSPDGKTLLILTSGYNRNEDAAARRVAAESNEYVFVYDVTRPAPVKKQVLQVSNTFVGIAWNPNGNEFYVSGGMDDNVNIFTRQSSGLFAATGKVALNHVKGNGLLSNAPPPFSDFAPLPAAAGLAVTADGRYLVVANMENDSISMIDIGARTKMRDLDLRPGASDPSKAGVPGGEYPYWVAIKRNEKAYISSLRDREIVVVDLPGLTVAKRIPVPGQPNKMILNPDQSVLFAAADNQDMVVLISTANDEILDTVDVAAPADMLGGRRLLGTNPNSLALSPDGRLLYVTNGGTNSVGVIRFATNAGQRNEVVGLIPTGWYPNSVSVSADGQRLFIVNGKSPAGPNPRNCRDRISVDKNDDVPCGSANQYILQLEKAGFQVVPKPSANHLAELTLQVAANNRFPILADHSRAAEIMSQVRSRVKHVIYVVKENRTYDQILGDLEKGNGDPNMVVFPEAVSPNHHRLARNFVTLDNFYVSGEVSGVGWNWSTAARTTDYTEKTIAPNYGGRGLTYDYEGTNRNINVGIARLGDRVAASPLMVPDPRLQPDVNLFPGTADVAAPDAEESGAGYLWDGALRAGLTVRNYGFFVDGVRYESAGGLNPTYIPITTDAGVRRLVQAIPAKASLMDKTAPYFRGFDQKNADYYCFKEWEREFDQYVANKNLPNLSLVRLAHDHFGNFGDAEFGVNTPPTQMADNDYALGMLVEKIANSPYKSDTLIFVIEDDAQDGPDHVDAHRSIAYVVGPYVKQGPVISNPYTTVSMYRTIEDVLGIEPVGLYDGLAEPMADVFDLSQTTWNYTAIVPEILRTTKLPVPPRTATNSMPLTPEVLASLRQLHDAAWWQEKLGDMSFEREDKLDTDRFNRVIWEGIRGAKVPYPDVRHGRDLRRNRKALLKDARAAWQSSGGIGE